MLKCIDVCYVEIVTGNPSCGPPWNYTSQEDRCQNLIPREALPPNLPVLTDPAHTTVEHLDMLLEHWRKRKNMKRVKQPFYFSHRLSSQAPYKILPPINSGTTSVKKPSAVKAKSTSSAKTRSSAKAKGKAKARDVEEELAETTEESEEPEEWAGEGDEDSGEEELMDDHPGEVGDDEGDDLDDHDNDGSDDDDNGGDNGADEIDVHLNDHTVDQTGGNNLERDDPPAMIENIPAVVAVHDDVVCISSYVPSYYLIIFYLL